MNNIDILEEMIKNTKTNRRGNKEIKFEVNSNYYTAISTLIAESKKLKEENLELLTRLRADGLIDRDKYWINKIKEAIYKGTLEAKGWDCEDGAYCVEKEFQKLLGKE